MTERILNDRYALEQKVGEGGMAVTYRARDLLLNRTVAVKLMREQFTTDQQFVERFRREAQAAARLSHENIASVYDTGRANGTYYIVMEYVEGTDLKQRLRRDGALSVLTTLEIGRQIAAALDAAHRSGLVHRDIKPHNILLNQEGSVRVTDFGIAKLASDGEDTGVIIGSVHYISPEQARGETTTPSSDLYSLGAVLFEMLTGRTVFEADNAMAVAHKQIYERPPLLRSLRPEIPPEVESLVLRCLEKDPRARYQSAAEVQAVLTKLLNQLSQEETIVITPSAPSMDATMVFPAPLPAAPAAPAPRPQAPLPRAVEPELEEHRGSGRGWLIALLFIVLSIAVGFGAYTVLSKGGAHPSASGPSIADQVPMPNLIGSSKEDALAKLAELGLTGNVQTTFDDHTPPNAVVRQAPDAAEQVKKGATVTITISNGPLTFALPDVSGMTQSEAQNAVHEAAGSDFAVKFGVKAESSDTVPKGQVIRTSPGAATLVKRNATVTLVVSTGQGAQPREVTETYNESVPSLPGLDEVYVRVEIVRPGEPPQEIWADTRKPGDAISQTFTRKVDEQDTIRLLAGRDADNLEVMGEVPAGPGPKPTLSTNE